MLIDEENAYDIEEHDSALPFRESDSEEVIEERIVQMYTKQSTTSSSSKYSTLEDEEDLEQIHTVSGFTAYTHSYLLSTLFIVGCLCTLGLLLLLCKWYPALQVYLTHWRCSTKLRHATTVLLKSKVSGDLTVCQVREVAFYIKKKFVKVKIYSYRHACFIYDPSLDMFVRVAFNTSFSFPHIQANMKMPIGGTTRLIREQLFGRNEIRVPVKSVFQLLVDEVLHPFYLFQVVSCIIWYVDEYFVYATVIIVTSTFSAILGLIETRSNMAKLRSMAKFECKVNKALKGNLYRSSSSSTSPSIEYVFKNVSSSDLVPGDIVEVEDGSLLPCDILLISGQCIVNEAMLTGESIPVVKNAIPTQAHAHEVYSVNNHKNYTLYSGTQVMQTRLFGGNKVLGICVRTGFETAKGKLMLSILYPKPTQFKFYQDSFKFIGVMFILGFVGIIYSAIRLKQKGVTVFSICLRALDVITIAVPPSLPIAMTVGVGFAISRLRSKNIFCISPPRVNVSGKINCMCFDKTGTLTEEGLDLFGVRSVTATQDEENSFNELIHAEELLDGLADESTDSTVSKETKESNNTLLLYAMASCHSLTYVKKDLVGDPLEQKIFQATEWTLNEPQHSGSQESAITAIVHPQRSNEDDIDLENFSGKGLPLELGILRRFDFSSALQRMSVIVKNLQSSETLVFVKGSPEAIAKLSHKNTLPANFESILYGYAHQGFRVLACGYKRMPASFDWRKAQKAQREEIESDLQFLGLIVMQNRMKHDTPSVIRKLNRSQIESIMVTGDNAFTAISVARQCGIISQNMKIYFGEVQEDKEENKTNIVWKDIESDSLLDPVSLLPLDGVQVGDYELAITGSVFEHLLTEHMVFKERKLEEEAKFKAEKRSKPKGWADRHSTFQRMLVMSHIYARMSPDQKLILSEQLQELGYFVGFCGDGANDCGALKASHIGISLSDAEASIAAPFTSIRPTIACVPTVIKEGRAALQTSFQMFKYIACYSMIQFFTVIMLYETNSTLGDYQFLFADLGLVLPTVLLMSRTAARAVLVKQKPVGSLINKVVLLSLFSQLLLAFGVQIFAFWLVRQQAFYSPITPKQETKENIHCFETTTLFTLSMYQTFGCAVAYSISKPFKKPLYTNKLYSITLVFVIGLLSYITLDPDYYTRYWLEFVDIPTYFRFVIVGLSIAHILVSFAFERFFIAGPGIAVIKMISIRKVVSGVQYLLHYLHILGDGTIGNSSSKITAKLMTSRKRYNILKRQFYESYFILRTQKHL